MNKYDKNGNIVLTSYDGVFITNTYDSYNNLIRTEHSNGYWAKFSYDRNGYITHYENSNGYTENHKY